MEKKLNILTVIRHPIGGIRTYIKYTYPWLDKDRYNFTILTIHVEETDILRADLKDCNCEVLEVGGRYMIPKMILKLFYLLWNQKIDIIHSHGFTAGMLTSIVNFFFLIPHIITTHMVFDGIKFSPGFGSLKKKVYGFLLTRANTIHSVSYDAQENLVSYLPSLSKKREKLVVIPNGISVEDFCNQPEGSPLRLCEEIGIKNDAFLFGFLGRFMPRKGFSYLIDAVEELSRNGEFSGRFKIIAVNDGAFVREYQKIIQEKNISDYFIFYGFVSNVSRIMKEIDAVIIPSIHEGWPLVPMEAFVLGCPVIATNCIGLREVIAGTPAVVIEKIADPNSIADALKSFMNNSIQVKKETIAFVDKAKERFDSKSSARALDMLFKKVAVNRETDRLNSP